MPRVGVALGSNLGDRAANLRAAISTLREIASPGEDFLVAPAYQTEPVHCPPDSPVFHNAVVEFTWSGGSAHDLLEITQAAEKRLGRVVAPVRNAPRVIDIDLLYFGDQLIDTEDLVLPHPRLHERRFVLEPLADIRPELVLPGKSSAIRDLLLGLSSTEPPLIRVDS